MNDMPGVARVGHLRFFRPSVESVELTPMVSLKRHSLLKLVQLANLIITLIFSGPTGGLHIKQ